jgi:hypothetical protein
VLLGRPRHRRRHAPRPRHRGPVAGPRRRGARTRPRRPRTPSPVRLRRVPPRSRGRSRSAHRASPTA